MICSGLEESLFGVLLHIHKSDQSGSIIWSPSDEDVRASNIRRVGERSSSC